MSARRCRIAVLGAGVIGLSCAKRLARSYDVTIVAARFGVESDSVKATAIWHVYLVPETQWILSLARNTLEYLYRIAANAPEAGVQLVRGVELFRKGSPVRPSWADIPKLFEMLTGAEIASYNRAEEWEFPNSDLAALKESPVTWGYRIEAPSASMDKYLLWLEDDVRSCGVRFQRLHLDSLGRLEADYDVIVNCSGFGARELVGDRDFVPYQGQYFVLAATADAPVEYVGDDDHPGGMAYIIPRGGEVMVGGCAIEGVEDLVFTLDWADTMRRAGLYQPWLRDRRAADQKRPPVVCIRPCRKLGLRLEIDRAVACVPVIHNYGHGGSGFSLSWGCAETVEELVREILR